MYKANPRPFEENIEDGWIVRKFAADSNPLDLVWHADDATRIVVPLNKNDWMYQEDNSLPVRLDKELLVVKGIYHRIIKGTTDLIVKIKELPAG